MSGGLPKDVAKYTAPENGWINKDLFSAWGEMFVAQLPKDGLPHLLFMNRHGSHIYNVQFLKLMKEHNVHMRCLQHIPYHIPHMYWLQLFLITVIK